MRTLAVIGRGRINLLEETKENIEKYLIPLQDTQLFEKKVEDTHKESIDYHAAHANTGLMK
jgi:hypothetical protein